MSSVPISKPYVSKLTSPAKSDKKCTFVHNQVEENIRLNNRRTTDSETRKYIERVWSDCKVSVVWDTSAVRLLVEKKK